MRTRKTGLVVFWIGAALMIGMGLVASFWARAAYRNLSLAQVNETAWAYGGPLLGLWGSAVPLGAILAGVGVLLYVRARGSHIWLFGLGVFAVLLADILTKFRILPTPPHVPLLYGVAGGLILAFFLAILWFWAKRRATLAGPAKTAADLQLTGYVFLLIAMWYLCGDLSRPYQKALSDLPLSSPISTIVYLVLGWLFLLLSHYKSVRALRQQED
ncbi:hypothetical protein ACFLWA_00520 [Chloroflexota bacterium]